MNKTFGNDDARLAEWLLETYAPEDEVLAEIRARSTAAGLPDIQVAALDARHLEVLARASGARRAVEIGTLGGYSGVAILRGLGEGGELDTIDSEPRHADVARESFRRAGFAERARVHVGLALDVLPRLERRGPFDLVFIDADKEGYPRYLDWAAQNLRPGGIVLLDNAFLFGHLPEAPAGERAASIRAMQAVHQTLAGSGKFRATPLPTGEGLALGVRI
ncbi:MAG TPA: O-methyltransferase [Polyangia bacterium]|jgi:caffeoyl-CoA O-methyltransferase|nr:O-methyltransferase [Polyangia bacterium]